MKTPLAKLSLLAAACAFAACSSVTTTTDYDHTAPFAKYRTYTLAPAAHDQTLSPAVEGALRDSLRSALAAKGLSESKGNGDIDVVRHVFVQQKTEVTHYTDWGYGYNQWPYRYGYYGMWNGAPRTYTDVNQYNQGTMILDFVDSHTKKLVFRGTGQAVVGDAQGNAEKVREAVDKIVSDFPGRTPAAQ